jgi:glycosyltransferase involved in cell wall biosynthesis
LKIVFVGNFALWRKGTMGSRALPMARELRAAGHDAVLVVPPWDAPDEADSAQRVWGVPVRNVPIRRGLARHPGIVFDLLSATLAERPDVVVAVKAKAYAGLLAQLLRGLRVVVDADDDEAGWSELAGDPAPIRAFVAWHERAVIHRADHLLAASRAIEHRALELRAGDVTYLPNATWPGAAGWPRSDGSRARATLTLGDAPTVLLYSRLFELSLDRLVSMLSRIAKAVPTVRLLVVGTGLQDEELRLRAALDQAGLLERAVLVGWAKREELPDLLAAGDVALVPMEDTAVNRARCSVKLLDLMLAGRPIVADAVGQAAVYLRDDETGRLVDPRDAEGMATAAIALLRHPASAGRLGAAASAAARSELTWERQREKLVAAVVGR